MTLRIAVLGVGRIGRMHADLIANRVDGLDLAMVHDVNARAAAEVGGLLDVAHTTDIDAVLESDDVDAVAICSSTDTHVPLMIEAARSGKAIFCEKPISLDLGRVDEALAIAARGRRPDPDRIQPPLRRRPQVGSRRGRERRARRSPSRPHHEPRSGAAPGGVHQGVGRDIPRHDDPRLRHGSLRDGQ